MINKNLINDKSKSKNNEILGHTDVGRFHHPSQCQTELEMQNYISEWENNHPNDKIKVSDVELTYDPYVYLNKFLVCGGYHNPLDDTYGIRRLKYLYHSPKDSGGNGFDIKNNFGLIALAIVAIIVLIFAFKK